MEGLPVMPEFDRSELERQLAKVLSKDLRDELKKLLDMLGDPPDMSNVPYTYWQTGWKLIAKHVEPILVTFFIQQALEALEEVQITIDLAQINTDAIEWARNNSEQWLQQTFNRTYEGVGTLIPQAYEEGWTLKELTTALERYYSPVRAEMIAVTEMTRASTEAEKATEARLSAITGKHRVPIWFTAKDEHVCKVCGPKNNLPIIDDEYPPAHPRCRCRLAYKWEEMLTPEQQVVWGNRGAKYSPDQPRVPAGNANGGEWTDGGSTYGGWTQTSTLDEAEKYIYQRTSEWAYVVARNGDVVVKKSGDQNSVAFTDKELSRMENNVLTHNHPANNSFSPEDILLAADTNLAEFRAVGSTNIYIMRRPDSGWPKLNEIEKAFNSRQSEVAELLGSQIRAGSITPSQASVMHFHEIWVRASKDLGLIYSFSEHGWN